MKLIRRFLSWVILTLDRAFPPKALERSTAEQQGVNQEVAGMILYQFEGCPFCVKVRRKARELNLPIEIRDVLKNKEFEKELLEGGGEYQVPCLKIPASSVSTGSEKGGTDRWLYESSEINRYLTERFGNRI